MKFLGVSLLLLAATPIAAQDVTELQVAKDILSRIQPRSFEKHAEFCGYVGFNDKGVMVASDPVEGDQDSCGAAFPRNMAVTASYHTHGDFDPGYFNEVPSQVDVDGDKKFYMNGYVATPGGRLWFIDTQIMVIRQICGIGCLPVAPSFRKGTSGNVAPAYSYDELVEKLGE